MGNCYFKGVGTEAQIRVPIYEEELKYYQSIMKEEEKVIDSPWCIGKSLHRKLASNISTGPYLVVQYIFLYSNFLEIFDI